MNAVEQTLCGLLRDVADVSGELTIETDLLDELKLESVQVMEFVMEIEDHFEIVIEQAQLGNVRTIAQLALIVGAHTT